MGGIGKNAVQFQLMWKQNPSQTVEIVRNREGVTNYYGENPRLARTTDDLETVPPSQMQTRVHTPGPRQLTLRYMKVDRLGAGQFGVVYKALNVDTGKFLAVKIIQRPEQPSEEAGWKETWYYALKREVETLSQISHVSNTCMLSRIELTLP
jgi:serine/threonine protein kinase